MKSIIHISDKFLLIDAPEKPEYLKYCQSFSPNYPCDGNGTEEAVKAGYCLCHEILDNYEAALQQAIANGIEIVNLPIIGGDINISIRKNELHPLPFGYTYKIENREINGDCGPCGCIDKCKKQVAYLVPVVNTLTVHWPNPKPEVVPVEEKKESVFRKFKETSALKDGYSQMFPIARAFGFKDDYDLQSSLGGQLMGNQFEKSILWLFEHGFDIIKTPDPSPLPVEQFKTAEELCNKHNCPDCNQQCCICEPVPLPYFATDEDKPVEQFTALQIAVYAVNCNNSDEYINEVCNLIESYAQQYKSALESDKKHENNIQIQTRGDR